MSIIFSKNKNFLTKSSAKTKEIAKNLAKIIKKKIHQCVVIGLSGQLGSGKTTFVQGFAKELGIKEKILSPTFVIIKKFKISTKQINFHYFYHIDCYRISKPEEILNLEFKNIINNQKNIVVIEWPERIKKILPKDTIWINFKIIDNKTRKIVVDK